MVSDLIHGIEAWASEEDGVCPGVWDAYLKALFFVGDIQKMTKCMEGNHVEDRMD